MGSVQQKKPDYDVLFIGAGLSGCYASHRMKQLNLTVKVLEAATSVGGTWYWNRYPGCRFDSESYTYAFFFSKEMLDEWNWTEHFAPQPETERYIRFMCGKLDLWNEMQFNTRISSAHWMADDCCWKLTDDSGKTYTSRFLITGLGLLSNPTLPNVPGVEDFKGTAYHTSRWPKEEVKSEGKRVGIIGEKVPYPDSLRVSDETSRTAWTIADHSAVGTGATAIQTIPMIAKTAESLTVFQRTANWAIPLLNSKIEQPEMDDIRTRYPQMLDRLMETRMCFLHDANYSDSIWDYTPEQREAFWEELYATPGFPMWLCNYKEISVDEEANALVTDSVTRKTKARVNDPWTADKLIPKNHGFGTRRVPMETNYFEAYNRPNVRHIDLLETPIDRVTETVTGAFDAIDFRGIDNNSLLEEWKDGPRTFLGITVEHFPNMFMSMGPHQAYGNIPRSIESAVGWIAECVEYCRDHNITYIEAQDKGVREWTDHVHDLGKNLLSNKVDSWMTGVNRNVAGKEKRTVARYMGSAPDFRKKCEEVSGANYKAFMLA